jgi:putative inorganic carbon (HCO3(-)) transporter
MKFPRGLWAYIRNWTWVAGLLLVLPLFFWRGFTEQFSTPKSFLTKSLIIAGLAVWALGVKRPALPRGKTSLALPLLVFCFAALVSCLNSPVPRFSLLEVELALCGPAWVLVLVSWDRGESSLHRLAMLTGAAGALVAGIALLQRLGYDPLLLGGYHVNWGTMVARMRLYSTLGNPNFVGGYLIGAIFPALALAAVSKARWATGSWLGLAAVMGSAIIATGSRGAWFGLAAGLAVAAWIVRKNSSARKEVREPGARADGKIHGIAALLGYGPTALLILTLAERIVAQLHGRVYLWRFSWPIFTEHPILGSGWGTYQLLYLDFQAKFLAAHPNDLGYWTNNRLLHNDPLQLLLEAGLFGFGAFVWLLWEYAREARRVLWEVPGPWIRYGIAASAGGVTAVLADSLFNFQFAVAPTFMLLFTLLAFPTLLRDSGIERGSQSQPPIGQHESSPLHRGRRSALAREGGEHSERGEGYGPGRPRRSLWRRALKLAGGLAVLAAGGGLLWQETRVLASERAYQAAMALEDHNNLGGAEAAYRRSVNLNSLNGRAHFGLSRVLYLRGRFPGALQQVMLAERTYADSHQEVLRARILDQMGRDPEALAAYRRALWLDPTLTSVQADIARLSHAR